ncbi:MAG: response regulator transcription factor [Flavobacteriales bacterium]|nr:response regulator transcription factor [Flavobacteriales bacterium]
MAKSKLDKPPPVAVALLDSHWLIREAIGCWLKECVGYQVVWKGNTRAELEQALDAGLQVKLVVVAVAIGEDEGHLAVKWLREEWPALYCVAYAHRHDELTMLRVYRKGVQVFLHDTVEGDAVLCALNAALVGGVFHSAVSQQLLLENPDGLTEKERERERLKARMTRKELEVLQAMGKFPDHTVGRLARQLGISPNTVDSHLKRLYELFKLRSKPGVLMEAVRLGLLPGKVQA